MSARPRLAPNNRGRSEHMDDLLGKEVATQETIKMHWIYAHLIGDYLLQNDWIAKGKKANSWICTIHVMIYMSPFIFTGLAWWKLLLIALQHWLQDRTDFVPWSMKIMGRNEFAVQPLAPWSIIITDNIFHILWIAFVIAL